MNNNNDNYMADKRAKTIEGFKIVFDIIAKYSTQTSRPIGAAEHDIIYINLDIYQCPEISEDGQLLEALGCHVDETECWAMFV